MYSNSCCSCSFEPEIIKIGQLSHKMYSNEIVNFQESTTILNVCTEKSGNSLKAPRTYVCTCINESVIFCYFNFFVFYVLFFYVYLLFF